MSEISIYMKKYRNISKI